MKSLVLLVLLCFCVSGCAGYGRLICGDCKVKSYNFVSINGADCDCTGVKQPEIQFQSNTTKVVKEDKSYNRYFKSGDREERKY